MTKQILNMTMAKEKNKLTMYAKGLRHIDSQKKELKYKLLTPEMELVYS